MPVLLLWKRTDCSSGEKEAPPMRTVSMNCSMVYCLTARAFDAFGLACRAAAGEADSASAATTKAKFRVTPVSLRKNSFALIGVFLESVCVLEGACGPGRTPKPDARAEWANQSATLIERPRRRESFPRKGRKRKGEKVKRGK